MHIIAQLKRSLLMESQANIFGIENSDPKLDPKFEVGDQVRISKCKNFFAKDYTPNWFEEVFVIKKSENVVPWTCVIEHLNGEQIANVLRKIRV